MEGKTEHEWQLAADGGRRAAYLQRLREELLLLSTHPDLPAPDVTPHSHMIRTGTDEEMTARIDRYAADLGETAHWEDGRYLVRHDLYQVECLPRIYPAAVTGIAA